jgi:hypothetical protein
MLTTATPCKRFVAEFGTPVSITCERPNSAQASNGDTARAQGVHLPTWLGRDAVHRPAAIRGARRIVLRPLPPGVTSPQSNRARAARSTLAP